VRLLRDGVQIHDGRVGSLKRFKDDVREVATGFECGIGLEGYNDVKIGDVIEAYVVEEKPASLE
jgi:translation initiation factor IF-2